MGGDWKQQVSTPRFTFQSSKTLVRKWLHYTNLHILHWYKVWVAEATIISAALYCITVLLNSPSAFLISSLLIEIRTKTMAILGHYLSSSSMLKPGGKMMKHLKQLTKPVLASPAPACFAQRYITVDLVRSYCLTMMFAPWESQKCCFVWCKMRLIKNVFDLPSVYSFKRTVILKGVNFASNVTVQMSPGNYSLGATAIRLVRHDLNQVLNLKWGD